MAAFVTWHQSHMFGDCALIKRETKLPSGLANFLLECELAGKVPGVVVINKFRNNTFLAK